MADEVTRRCRELGIPDEATRRNRTPRSVQEDPLCQELLKPVAGFDPLVQLANCRARALDDRGRLKSGGLVETMNALKEQFQARHGDPVANQPGVTYAVLQGNRDRVLAPVRPEEGRPQSVARELLDLCARRGPATAGAVARGVRAAMAEELAFLEEGLKEVRPQADQAPRNLEDCWSFANLSLLSQVLQRKKEVYENLGPWLEKLARRFDHFSKYLQDYQASLGAADGGVECKAPSLVLPKSEIERLEAALTAPSGDGLGLLKTRTTDPQGGTRPGLLEQLEELVRQGLPEQDAEGSPTLFASGPPKLRGAVDYSHLQELEKAAFERVSGAQGLANPYNVDVLSVLKEEAVQTQRPFPNLFAEAEPLIQFQGDAADYLNLSFGKAGTHCSLMVQENQDGYPELVQKAASGKSWLESWRGGAQEESIQDTLTQRWSPWSVAYAVERCSIKTHLVTGYDLPGRQALLYAGQETQDWFPALSDRRIKLPPLEADLDEARSLLFGSIVLGRWTFLSPTEGYELAYQRQDEGGRPLDERYRAQGDLELASRDLAHRPDVREAIKRNVRAYLKDNLGLAADGLKKAVEIINGQRLVARNQTWGDLPGLHLYGVHYRRTTEGVLAFCTLFGIPLPTVAHGYAQSLKTGAPRPGQGGSTPQDGWYCTRCGHLFGQSEPDRRLECPSCKNPN